MPVSTDDIANCDTCGSSMDVAGLAPFTKVECPQCGKHTRVKKVFGPYTLLRRHAIGGMSVVFVAHDQTLNREVAVKILNESYSADVRRIAAFEEEARITASFSHPHVVRVFTTGRAFQRFFIAMEFVTGGHFEHQIESRGKIPEREMLPLAVQVVDGLKAAHAAGLIHRDIKPGNILLDSDGNAKIVDFGLALLLDKGGSAQAKEIWATPYYVPPESIEGHAEDFRSDMYALGATLYHALAGKPPCNEESMNTQILREAKRKVIPLHVAAPWVTPATCAVVDQAMAYAADKRFKSYDEMIMRLKEAIKNLKSGKSALRPGQSTAKARGNGMSYKSHALLVTGGVVVVGLLAWAAWHRLSKADSKGGPGGAAETNGVVNSSTVVQRVNPSSATRIADHYKQARAALARQEYGQAHDLFAALHADPEVQEPTRTWLGVEAVVMLYLDGKSGKARSEAQAMVAHLSAARLEDKSIKEVLLPVLDRARALPVIAAEPGALSGSGLARMLACMLAGLKDWDQGCLTEACKFFDAVCKMKLDTQDSWAAIYQKLAGDYLADYKTLSGPVFEQAPMDKAASEEAARELDELMPRLKTLGRAPYNVKAWKLDMLKQAQRQEGRADPVKDKPGEVPVAAPSLEEVLETLAKHANSCDFVTASGYLESLSNDPDGASRKALLALTNSAALFLSDLTERVKRGKVAVAGRLKAGGTFNQIEASNLADKMVATPDSGQLTLCGWGDISPVTIIDLYRLLIKNETNDQLKLQCNVGAIAFEWLAGDREQAVTLAENFSANNPLFKEKWKDIKKGLPKPGKSPPK